MKANTRDEASPVQRPKQFNFPQRLGLGLMQLTSMKRVLTLACLALVVILAACTASEHTTLNGDSMNSVEASSAAMELTAPTQLPASQGEEPDHAVATPDDSELGSEQADSAESVNQSAQPAQTTAPRTGNSSSSDSGVQNTNGTGNQSNPNRSSSASGGTGQTPSAGSQPGNATTPSRPQATAPNTITVSIEIEARTAHAADATALPGSFVNGVLLSRRSLTLPADATVRQALDAASSAHGVRVNARGAYIAGIGGLSEGDLGARSGWMYSLNGQFPNNSASAQRLNAGDVIVWRYTVNGGVDVGAPR